MGIFLFPSILWIISYFSKRTKESSLFIKGFVLTVLSVCVIFLTFFVFWKNEKFLYLCPRVFIQKITSSIFSFIFFANKRHLFLLFHSAYMLFTIAFISFFYFFVKRNKIWVFCPCFYSFYSIFSFWPRDRGCFLLPIFPFMSIASALFFDDLFKRINKHVLKIVLVTALFLLLAVQFLHFFY